MSANKGICSVAECAKPAHAKGFCPMHYQRNRIRGSVHYVRPKESAKQFEARFWSSVDKSSGCWVWTGNKNASGYGVTYLNNSSIRAHRVAYEMSRGQIPAGMVIDHICHNEACVRPGHLRVATVKQNAENRAGSRRGSRSGVRGVSWDSRSGKWKASATHAYTKHVAGMFTTIEEAAEAAQELRNQLFTHNTLDRIAS